MSEHVEQLARLAATQANIDRLDEERTQLVDDLDATITTLRAVGCTWSAINAACGTTNVQMSYQRRADRR